MEQTLFDKIVVFLSNHFELLLYINVLSVIFFVTMIITIKLRDVSIRQLIRTTVRALLLCVILIGQILLFLILGSLYWKNYKNPNVPELQIMKEVKGTTNWVQDNVVIYFIDKNKLRSLNSNGKNNTIVFQSDSPIHEYHFSPDGTYIAIVTKKDLFLVNRKTGKSNQIDTLVRPGLTQQWGEKSTAQGSISGIQWSPDSQRFCYEIARWSKIGEQDNVYVYSINDQSKQSIRSPTRRISSLYWGEEGKNLYFLRHEAQDPSLHPALFEVKVSQIPLTTLVPAFLTQISFEKSSIPIENLRHRGINLFLDGAKLSFGHAQQEDHLISEHGSSIGIDDEDYLYYAKKNLFRRRLFKIPREKPNTDLARYHYKGGDLIVDHIRWIPGGRYVVMEHKHLGVVILDPASGKIGVLFEANGRAFGWYE